MIKPRWQVFFLTCLWWCYCLCLCVRLNTLQWTAVNSLHLRVEQNPAVVHGAAVQQQAAEVAVQQLHAGFGDSLLLSVPVESIRRNPAAPQFTGPSARFVFVVKRSKRSSFAGFCWFASSFLSGPLISLSELDRLSNIRSLALDFSDFTSELCGLLASPRRTPLHRLALLLNGTALEFKPLEGTATEEDWKALVKAT